MSKNETKWYKSIWTVSLVTSTILPALISIIYDKIKSNPFLTTLSEIWNWLWNCIMYLLNYEVKIWWLFGLSTIIYFLRKMILRRKTNQESKYPTYIEGMYKKILWKWRYFYYYGELGITSLEPHCPKCRTLLHSDDFSMGYSNLQCLRCKNKIKYRVESNDKEKIKKLILGNIENKFYPSSIDAKSPSNGSNS
ncbi:MAG: hypothetical protein JNL36_05495 [Candidatus Kapabacteria bacterium]|nr:hypothetical protein [Candidatus Kapabacteria bacterium]